MGERFDEQFFKEVFRGEMQRRYALDSASTMPIAVLSAFGGASAYYVQQAWSGQFGVFQLTIVLGAVALAATTIVAAVYLIMSLWNYTIADLPFPDELEHHLTELREFYKGPDGSAVEALVEDEFRRERARDYRIAAQVNAESNEWRARCLFRVRRWLVVAAMIFLLTSFIYWTSRGSSSDEPSSRLLQKESNGRAEK